MIWRRAKDPSVAQLKFELLFGIWVFLVEACWILYGNSFIYDTEIKQCDVHTTRSILSSETERTTVMVLVIYGYFLLAGIVATIVF